MPSSFNSVLSASYTFPFAINKADTSYSASLAISNFYQSFDFSYYSRDSLVVNEVSRSFDQMTVQARTLIPINYISRLWIRWLIVESSFPYIYCVTLE